MALADRIIGVESGGNPHAANLSVPPTHMGTKLVTHAHILELLFAGRPTAVFRTVVTIAINAVNRMIFARPVSHVGEEVFKVASPSFANLNSSRAVVFVRSVRGLFATSNHAIPNFILVSCPSIAAYGLRHPMSFFSSLHLGRTASATYSVARTKIGDWHNCLFSAVAYAKHLADGSIAVPSKFGSGFGNCSQSAKLDPNAIYGGCH